MRGMLCNGGQIIVDNRMGGAVRRGGARWFKYPLRRPGIHKGSEKEKRRRWMAVLKATRRIDPVAIVTAARACREGSGPPVV